MVVGSTPSLYVGDLSEETTEALLFERFNQVGPVASVRVCRDGATRRSLGYAYVNFHRIEDAERALDTMNFVSIRGRPCRIMWSHRDPALRKSGVGNIFVKNLAKTIDNKSLYDTFSMFGNILSCKVATDPSTGASLGYGFVHYESDENAQNAIRRVDGKVIAGKQVVVSSFKSKHERPKQDNFTNIYIKNVPTDWDAQTLVKHFSPYGTVTSNLIVVDPHGNSKGFGFINYSAPKEAQEAIKKMNAKDLGLGEEKKLIVCRAQKKNERGRELREHFKQLKLQRQSKFTGANLYIKNLADDVDDEKLRSDFSQYGVITSARVMTKNDKSRGFGFVCFATADEANRAVTETNGRMVNGKPLYVALAQRKDVRRAHLEAQFASRSKMGQMGQPVFQRPPQHMFYQGVPPRMMPPYRQGMVGQFPPNVPPGVIPGAPPGPMMRHQSFQLMPAMNNTTNRVPRQRRNIGKSQNATQIQDVKYSMNVRNRNRFQQTVLPAPQQGPMPQQLGPMAQQIGQMPPQLGQMHQMGQNLQQHTTNPQHQPRPQRPQALEHENLTIKALAAAPEEQKKQMIGERLFPRIKAQESQLAGKITGMLLEMDNGELLHLLESPTALNEKIQEALQVLHEHEQNA